MKKIFTLLLMFACALFVGVSCVQDQPEGAPEGGAGDVPEEEVIDEVTPETFEVKFVEPLSCANVEYYCIPANKTKPYMLISSQEFNDDSVKGMISGNTVEEKLKSLLKGRIEASQLWLPVDNNALYKGNSSNYPKLATRYSNTEKVEVYVVGVKVLETKTMLSGEQEIIAAELSTEVTTVEVPFLPYPELTLGQTAVEVSYEAGSTTIDCTLENPIEGNEVRCESSATWVNASYENGVLTVTYDENPASIVRKAELTVEYGKWEEITINKEVKTNWVSLVNEKVVTVTQGKNPTAPVYTFDIEFVESCFNKVVVNITPSADALKDNVDYVAKVHNKDYDWATVAANSMRYPDSHTYWNGEQTNFAIKVSPSQLFIEDGDEYCVYVHAVDKAHTAPISEVFVITVVYTTEGTPVLGFEEKEVVDGDGAHYKVYDNSANNSGDWVVEISKGGLVEIPFVIENPIDGYDVYFNVYLPGGDKLQEMSLSDYDNRFGVVGEGGLVSTKDGKLVFTANDYPSDWDKTWPPYISLGIKYTNESDDFCVTQQIKVKLIR